MKRSLKVVFFLLAAAVAIAVCAFLLIPHLSIITVCKDALLRSIESSTGQRPQAEKVGISLWKGLEIYADGVSFIRGEGKNAANEVRVKRVSAGIGILPLFERKIQITSISLSSPEVPSVADLLGFLIVFGEKDQIVQGPGNPTSGRVSRSRTNTHDAAPFSIDLSQVDEVIVKNGSMRLSNGLSVAKDERLMMKDISITARREGPLTVGLVSNASLAPGASNLIVNGKIALNDSQPDWRFDLKGRLNSVNIAPVLNLILKASGISIAKGRLQLDFKVDGDTREGIRIYGEGEFNELFLQAISRLHVQSGPLNGKVSFDSFLKSSILQLRDAKINTGKMQASFEGVFDLKKKNPLVQFKVK